MMTTGRITWFPMHPLAFKFSPIRGLHLNIVHLGGLDGIWRTHAWRARKQNAIEDNADGVIFFIDLADTDQYDGACKQLHTPLHQLEGPIGSREGHTKCPMPVLRNKTARRGLTDGLP